MRKFILVATALLLTGCGAAPMAPVVQPVAHDEAQASLLDKISASAVWNQKEGRASVAFKIITLTGKAGAEDRVTFSTDKGKTGAVSKLLLGQDGRLYVSSQTATPRVYDYYAVGTYKGTNPLSYTLVKGAKLKYKHGIPVPMFDYDYIIITLPALPSAEKSEPAWAKLSS